MVTVRFCKWFTVFLCAFSAVSFAQQSIIVGSKTAYQYDTEQKITPAPVGYVAFYIDHVGRHGSRYISKSKSEDIAYQILSMAEKQDKLTNLGKDLLRQIIRISELNKNHYGQLTDLGRKDIALISQRMLNNNPTVFNGKEIDVVSSSSPRAKETAEIFVSSFKSKYPNIHVTQQPEDQQTLLRFFDYSPDYDEYKHSKIVKNAVKSVENAPKTQQISKQVAKKIFVDDFIQKLDSGIEVVDKPSVTTRDFVIAIYQLYQELQAFSPQLLKDNYLDLNSYFLVDENTWLNTVVTAKNYLEIGPAFDANGIQIKIAAPLLWDMLNTADIAIANNNIDANLRFAHAETISPLATLLEIEGTSTVAESIFDYYAVWQADKIIPMGANIQWIFYKSEQANQPVLVKVLLNEREVHLPIKSAQYPYYRWSDIKQFYTDKLNKLGLSYVPSPVAN
ncbi:histidine-type phosphatase [Gilliamella sp. Pra-s65]|uniref:histidine-type phosphatase n=1 Tax=unclassified Gilliamella TaxID=2685620 RepID=UPI0013658A01|nr:MULTISPECIES: histidine-type phosphatase [unclassified Gilliamella]MWN90282.1 histidine-type phosphatase [Gilliamella sp. Pra-s65]MWP73261.1 histidine-type phosphatase [Gilliamella sp. Pra-s52]